MAEVDQSRVQCVLSLLFDYQAVGFSFILQARHSVSRAGDQRNLHVLVDALTDHLPLGYHLDTSYI